MQTVWRLWSEDRCSDKVSVPRSIFICTEGVNIFALVFEFDSTKHEHLVFPLGVLYVMR